LTSGKEACEKLLKPPTFKQQLLAMEAKLVWAVQNMVAWVKGFAWNMIFLRILPPICLAVAFLLPWLWLALAYTLKAFVAVTGWEPKSDSKNKAIP
jgi:hypothetical protein